MSITRSVLMALVAVSALTVMAPGHAEAPTYKEGQQLVAYNFVDDAKDRLQSTVEAIATPIVNPKEFACLAKNIFYEAASEPEEGKVAVGLVTLNRVQDGRFERSVCGVVNQKTSFDVAHKVKTVHMVKTGYFTAPKPVEETSTVWQKLSVCQFSWACMRVNTPKTDDERWEESQRIAKELLANDYSYSDLREKYSAALYFHARAIHPIWSHQKKMISRVGGHVFYAER